MSKKETAIQFVKIETDFCRICAALTCSEYSIYDQDVKNQQWGMTLHAMMEKLIPSVFNAEQIIQDKSLNWPNKLCQDCRGKVLDAYGLYDMCLKSGDLLKDQFPAEHITVATSRASPVRSEATKREKNTADVPHCSDEDEPREAHLDIESTPVLPPDGNGGKRKRRKTVQNGTSNKKTVPKAKKPKSEPASKYETQPTKIEEYRCLICDGPTYTSPYELTDHLKANHPDQIQSCDKCPKVFMTDQTFQHHQFCHATGRSYFCIFCDKGFRNQRLLTNHVRTHTHGTGFLCSVCGKEFSDRSNLRQHELRHTGDKPWACNQCPSRFSTKGYLTVHQHTHTKTKPFKCNSCGSQFNRHYSLVKHLVLHTGERHYACEVCKTRFASAYHVKIHMRTHTGEKPYKCGYCGRGFAQKNDMLKHTKIHGKPYPCDRCDASYLLLADLRNHWKEHDLADKQKVAPSSSEQ